MKYVIVNPNEEDSNTELFTASDVVTLIKHRGWSDYEVLKKDSSHIGGYVKLIATEDNKRIYTNPTQSIPKAFNSL